MPNTFAPRAFEQMVKSRASELRLEYEGAKVDVTEWHAMVDLLSPEATEEFLERYGDASQIPHVVSGIEDGLDPRADTPTVEE